MKLGRISFMFHPFPKPHTFRSKKYLRFVRQHPCCNCGHLIQIEAHHVRFDGNAGTSLKPPDVHTIPLCNDGPEHQCHALTQQFKEGGVDFEFALKIMVKLLSEYIEKMEKESP